jgi:hypothetical protein
MGKTAYILGAGFSKPAGFPKQAELFTGLVEKLSDFSPDEFIPFEIRSSISEFLTRCGFMAGGLLVFTITLEDLFTLLDQAISDRNSFVGFSWIELIKIRDHFIRGVLGLLHSSANRHLT